uniref:Maleylacetate reductase n=1 Tax=Pseudomonas aeruginosa TaxID=287 RepID=CLCE_PSEAI|nr:RecName: Full=Maleylacetate reductase [Pseudomonas aeruginosa]AAC69478.1 maleylacetate reductase [Pseudomonas aeruginosa]
MNFIHDYRSPRVIFGPDSLARLPQELERLGIDRALVLTTPEQAPLGRQVAEPVIGHVAAFYDGATMHVPALVAEEACKIARTSEANGVIAIGGGSTIGLAKIVALRTELPIVAVPTTYAGSEMTSIFGITEGGVKKTGRDARVMPRAVIYEPRLTLELPLSISVTSAINAIAHAVEGLYAPDATPLLTIMAQEGIAATVRAISRMYQSPRDLQARGDALYGAWLCASVVGNVSMALHHKLCHTLGGTLDLPHAQTHTVVLPHALAYNARAVPDAMRVLRIALGHDDPPTALYELARDNGAPVALRDLGMREEDIEHVGDLALQDRYPNPRELDRDALLALLRDAYHGRPPSA